MCKTLVSDGSGRCVAHPRKSWSKREDADKRITGRRLQAMRKRLFEEHPLCVECERQGRISAATRRDHIKPLAEGGSDDDTNIQGLCERCHDIKSEAERLRGMGCTSLVR
jgi:5-methylcytosine-specific restriction protein A